MWQLATRSDTLASATGTASGHCNTLQSARGTSRRPPSCRANTRSPLQRATLRVARTTRTAGGQRAPT
eukprot:2549277-Alexandrium_andersonii.AAC.1